jgi:hypothetical protein
MEKVILFLNKKDEMMNKMKQDEKLLDEMYKDALNALRKLRKMLNDLRIYVDDEYKYVFADAKLRWVDDDLIAGFGFYDEDGIWNEPNIECECCDEDDYGICQMYECYEWLRWDEIDGIHRKILVIELIIYWMRDMVKHAEDIIKRRNERMEWIKEKIEKLRECV